MVPFEESIEKANKSLENFRYFSCGNFTGRIYCSTLEDQFVKAFSLKNGKLNGQLKVLRRTDFDKQKDASKPKDYTVIQLHMDNQISTRTATTYTIDECYSDEGKICSHSTCLDEVVVSPCPGGCGNADYCTCDDGDNDDGDDSGGSEWSNPGGGTGTGGNNNSNQPSYNKISKTIFATKSATTVATYSTAAHRADGKDDGTPLARCNYGVRDMFNSFFTTKELNGMRANDMVKYWEANPTKWESITISEALTSVNDGWFVVAGRSNDSGSGHVVVLVPGAGVSKDWNYKTTLCPNVMETGYDMRRESGVINRSWREAHQGDVKFYRYK